MNTLAAMGTKEIMSKTDHSTLSDVELISIIQENNEAKNKGIKRSGREDLNAQYAQHEMLRRYRGLVHKQIRATSSFVKMTAVYDRNDVIAEAQSGILEAINKFDISRGAAFASYAELYVRDKVGVFTKMNTHSVSPFKSPKMKLGFKTAIAMKGQSQEAIYQALEEIGNITDFEKSQIVATANNMQQNFQTTDAGYVDPIDSADRSSFDLARSEYFGMVDDGFDECLNNQRTDVLKDAVNALYQRFEAPLVTAFLKNRSLTENFEEEENVYRLVDLTEELFDQGITNAKGHRFTVQYLYQIFEKIESSIKEELADREITSLSDLVA